MAADGDPRRFALGAGLDDIDLRARRVDTHPEAGQLPIPEYGVLALRREPIDGALGDGPVLQPRHCQASLDVLVQYI